MSKPDLFTDRLFLEKLVRVTEKHLHDETFSVPQLAREMGISRSGLHRKVKMQTGKSVSLFIRELRLKKSMELLHASSLTISEIAFGVGFGSVAYFDRCFRTYFGISPGEARKKIQPASDLVNQPGPTEAGISLAGKAVSLTSRKKQKGRALRWLAVLIPVVLMAFLASTWDQVMWQRIPGNDKSIAVLPFINESSDVTNVYFNNGVTDAITDRLANIRDLKVTSRNSAEVYRDNRTRSTPHIARKLRVRYLVEGSGQKSGDSVLITVQLIDALYDRHLLSKRYERRYADIFNLYNEIALDVAGEISALITTEELKNIRNPGLARMEAMRLYIQGEELFNIKNINPEKTPEYTVQSEAFARKALKLDPFYSDALLLLGEICFSNNKLDSAMVLAEQSLRNNPENPKAWVLKAGIYNRWRDPVNMEKSVRTALKYDAGHFQAHQMLGGLNYYRGNFQEAIQSLLRNRKRLGSFDPGLSHTELMCRELNTLRLARCLFALGFYAEGKVFADEWLALSNDDQLGYNYNLLWAGIVNSRLEETYQLGLRTPENNLWHDYMAMNLMFMDRYEEAWHYLQQSITLYKFRPGFDEALINCLLGFACHKTGRTSDAVAFFDKSLAILDFRLSQNGGTALPDFTYATTDRYWKYVYFILTSIHSVREEIPKALEYMRLLRDNYHANDLQVVTLLKKWPMFDNIRNEPEFRDYLKKAESHYLTEYEKVRQLIGREGLAQN